MAYLYAQSSHAWSANSGKWATAANGSGTTQPPAAGDTLDANGKTVTIDTHVELDGSSYLVGSAWIYTASSGKVIITANIGKAGVASTLNTLSHSGQGDLEINGDIHNASATNSIVAVIYSGGGALTVNCATVRPGTGVYNFGINKIGTGTLIVNCTSLTGGTISGAAVNLAAVSSGKATINVRGGYIKSGGSAAGVANLGTAVVSINVTDGGTIVNSGAGPAVNNGAGGTVNVTCPTLIQATSTGPSIVNVGAGTVNVTGSVAGSTTGSVGYGVRNDAGGTINVSGSITASAVCAGASNASTGNVNCLRAVGNDYGLGSSGMTSQPGIINTAGGLATATYLDCGSRGQFPVTGQCSLVPEIGNTMLFAASTGGTKTLLDPLDSDALPNPSDVRYPITYNYGNTTGTCRVPAAGSVALGVPVDAGLTGSALLSAAAVADAVAAVIPTVAATAAAVRSELTPELDNLDAAVSSRNATAPPTVAAIAAQVRTELGVELGRIDAAVSSAGNPSAIATAVWSGAPERLANVATVASTGAQIAAFESA